MRKIIIGIFLIGMTLLSCTSQNNNAQLSVALQSLNLSNQHIEDNNKQIYAALNQRLRDPIMHLNAEEWNPQAKAIQLIIDTAINYIDQLKIELKTLAGIKSDDKGLLNNNDYNSVEQLFNSKRKGEELANKMNAVKNNIVKALNSQRFNDNTSWKKYVQEISVKLNNELPIGDSITVETDNTGHARNRYSDYFKNTNTIGALVMLAKIQNDILLSEHLIINYIINKTKVHICEHPFPLVTQNSTTLKSGQQIEITAGIGIFSAATKPTFTINGKVATLNREDVAVYKLKINQAPGKYSIPVKVEFTQADGTQEVMEKNIKYQVLQ